ncbi:hypothetical protein L1987_09178 [Smallanthus sonchifolius]|uniref:Uncharacterized protein n=1 Tax=Smallanthus sonchifolius TaxID=185202 RepID=A0ACB9JMP6_9ASTR|nr:hypothetical protein L1987_09178 [Smallanthus sonchifolius]
MFKCSNVSWDMLNVNNKVQIFRAWVDKGKAIMIEQDDEPNPKSKLSKELEEELSRKAIEGILSQDYYDEVNAQVQLENTMAETTASWLSYILEDELKKEIERMRMEAKNVKRVYLKRKTPSVITPEALKSTHEVVTTQEEILKSTLESEKVTQELLLMRLVRLQIIFLKYIQRLQSRPLLLPERNP